ncbi:MAG: hypothetical protein JWM58_2419 [Rhizobium sp.]|nr:hypothetical protein [Rhizobium sp.]
MAKLFMIPPALAPVATALFARGNLAGPHVEIAVPVSSHQQIQRFFFFDIGALRVCDVIADDRRSIPRP